MKEKIFRIVENLVPKSIKYDYVHIKNLKKFNREIKKCNVVRKNGKKYVYTIKDFEEKNCIFVHIPRAAGSSVSEAVFGNLGGGHRTVKRYRAIFGRKFWSYYKFTFVRNPYTRLISAYEYLKSGGHPAWPSNQRFGQEVLESYSCFSDFVLNWLQPERSEWPVPHFLPQTHFLELDSKFPLDFVGCLERIEKDFEELSEKIDIEGDLPNNNKTPVDKKSLQYYYGKEKVLRRVKSFYRKDFKKLGYSNKLSNIKESPKIR